MEPCDTNRSCNLDASIFKGIFVRNLRYLLDVTKEKSRVKLYRRFLDTNIASLRHNASCQPHHNHTCHIVYLDGAPSYPATGPIFDTVWTGPFKARRIRMRENCFWHFKDMELKFMHAPPTQENTSAVELLCHFL